MPHPVSSDLNIDSEPLQLPRRLIYASPMPLLDPAVFFIGRRTSSHHLIVQPEQLDQFITLPFKAISYTSSAGGVKSIL
jgi:hypothetical protein